MAEQTWLSLSKVGELKGQKRQVKLSGVKVELNALDLEIRGEGEDAFGFIIEEGEQLRMEVLGELANTTKERPDAHQSRHTNTPHLHFRADRRGRRLSTQRGFTQ